MREEARGDKARSHREVRQSYRGGQGYREDQWRQYPTHVEFAENIVVAFEAVGLLKPSS
jgi:hypothetical protein